MTKQIKRHTIGLTVSQRKGIVANIPLVAQDAFSDGAADVLIRGRAAPGSIFETPTIERSLWREVTAAGVETARMTVRGCTLEQCDLSNAKLNHTAFIATRLQSCKGIGLQINTGTLRQVLLEDCQFEMAQFQYTRMQEVRFEQCMLRGAFFNGAQVAGTVFDGCDLTGCDFSGADISGSDFRRSRIEDIRVAPDQLRDVVVTSDQAVYLAGLIGLRIRE